MSSSAKRSTSADMPTIVVDYVRLLRDCAAATESDEQRQLYLQYAEQVEDSNRLRLSAAAESDRWCDEESLLIDAEGIDDEWR